MPAIPTLYRDNDGHEIRQRQVSGLRARCSLLGEALAVVPLNVQIDCLRDLAMAPDILRFREDATP